MKLCNLPKSSFSYWLKIYLALIATIKEITPVRTQSEQSKTCINQLIYNIALSFEWPRVTYLISPKTEELEIPSAEALIRLSGASIPQMSYYTEVLLNDSKWLAKQNFVATFFSESLLDAITLDKSARVKTGMAVLIDSDSQLRQLVDVISTAKFLLDSKFYVFDVSQCQKEVKIFGLYRVGDRLNETVVEYGGPWTTNGGFQDPKLSEDFMERRNDFLGYPMKGVGVKVFPHFNTYLKNGSITGFVGDLVTILQQAHNFSLNYKILDGYSYGTLANAINNSWNGMVGELQNRRADMTIAEVSVTMERSRVISYTHPLYMISRKMYVVNKVDTRQKLLTYFKPMSLDLYIAVFVMIVILSVCLYSISELQRRFIPPGKEKDEIGFGEAFWYMISANLQQGPTTSPDTISCRIVYWCGFVLAVFVFTAYSATLLSHLAVSLPIPLPFKDIYGLIQTDDWDAGNVKNDLLEVIASQTCAGSDKEECKSLNKLWKKVIMRSQGNLVTTYFEGLARAKERKYVFIGVDVSTNNYIKQLPLDEACAIREMPQQYITGGISIGVQHDSPFLPFFDLSLQKLKEMGVMKKLVRKWLKVDIVCPTAEIKAADLISVGAVFTMLILGIGFSLLILLGEYLMYSYKYRGKYMDELTLFTHSRMILF